MTSRYHQMNLFDQKTLNCTYEIKRRMRILIAKSHLSRDEIADQMSEAAAQEGMKISVSRGTIDNWVKDSDPGRLPSPACLTIFCHVMGSNWPIEAMLEPLGAGAISGDDCKVLAWGKAELERRAAGKRARLALESLEG